MRAGVSRVPNLVRICAGVLGSTARTLVYASKIVLARFKMSSAHLVDNRINSSRELPARKLMTVPYENIDAVRLR